MLIGELKALVNALPDEWPVDVCLVKFDRDRDDLFGPMEISSMKVQPMGDPYRLVLYVEP